MFLTRGPRAEDVLASLPDVVLGIDQQGALQFAAGPIVEQVGWDPQAWLGASIIDLIHPDDLSSALRALDTVVRKDVGLPLELRMRTAQGGWRWYEVVGRTRLDHPALTAIVISARDVTDRHRLSLGDERGLGVVLQLTPTLMFVLERSTVVRTCNASLTRQLGFDHEWMIGRDLTDIVAVEDRGRWRSTLARSRGLEPVGVEVGLVDIEGRTRPFRLEVVDLTDDPVVEGYVVSASDATEVVEARRELQRLADHDQLTGLLNQRVLLAAAQAALAAGTATGLLYVDLDGFKTVNDQLGHAAGDLVLQNIAARLRDIAGPHARSARLGGDEFAILLTDVPEDHLAEVAAAIEAAIREPLRVGSGVVRLSGSVGVASASAGIEAEELLAEADRAMYVAKAGGGPAA